MLGGPHRLPAGLGVGPHRAELEDRERAAAQVLLPPVVVGLAAGRAASGRSSPTRVCV
jgi:hypothetical protein